MQDIEKITFIIWKLIQQGFKVVNFEERIENSNINAHFIFLVELENEILGKISYTIRTYNVTPQFREVTSYKGTT